MPGAVPYYVDPGTDGDTLSALLSALPPLTEGPYQAFWSTSVNRLSPR